MLPGVIPGGRHDDGPSSLPKGSYGPRAALSLPRTADRCAATVPSAMPSAAIWVFFMANSQRITATACCCGGRPRWPASTAPARSPTPLPHACPPTAAGTPPPAAAGVHRAPHYGGSADREVADRRVQPAQPLRITQAPHSRPLPGGRHERGLNQVIGQGMVPPGERAGVSEQARAVRGKTLPELLSVVLRDLVTAHRSLRRSTRAATGGNHTAGQDHRTHDPGNPVPAGQHRTQAAGRRAPSPGSPEPRTRQRQPPGHGHRRRPAAAGPAPACQRRRISEISFTSLGRTRTANRLALTLARQQAHGGVRDIDAGTGVHRPDLPHRPP